jgi:hypothetical protein
VCQGQRRGDQLVLRGSWVGLAGSPGASIRNVPDDQTSTSCCASSSLSSEFKSSHAVNMRSHTFLSRNSAVAHRSLFAALDRDPCFRTTRRSGYVGGANQGRIHAGTTPHTWSGVPQSAAWVAPARSRDCVVCQPTWLGRDVTNVLTSLLLLK